MAVIKAKPTSPGRRGVIAVKSDLYKGKPLKSLTRVKSKNGGRNNNGRITVRHQGGGHKQHYRVIDFKRNKFDIPAVVERIEYDPNRSAHIALLLYKDGERRYIIAPSKLKVGDEIISSEKCEIKVGNSMKLKDIPLWECRATLGTVSNQENNLKSLGKAGAKRWRGVRPTVRGVAMNPVDHPHGGGEGRTSGGRHPSTPWGVPTKGYKTRKNQRTNDLIIRRRGSRK